MLGLMREKECLIRSSDLTGKKQGRVRIRRRVQVPQEAFITGLIFFNCLRGETLDGAPSIRADFNYRTNFQSDQIYST
jgi:hypothetical protein